MHPVARRFWALPTRVPRVGRRRLGDPVSFDPGGGTAASGERGAADTVMATPPVEASVGPPDGDVAPVRVDLDPAAEPGFDDDPAMAMWQEELDDPGLDQADFFGFEELLM